MGKTVFEKVWNQHVVSSHEDDSVLLYIDRHFVHEVTSPQAFDGLRMRNQGVWRSNSVVATPDHNVPTIDRDKGIEDPISRTQVEALAANCQQFSLLEFGMADERQGVVHVVGPEQGLTLPGMTVVCGDSHTSTHGAFGAIAMGIGTSEVEHVLATQCLIQKKPKVMRITIEGQLPKGSTSKDIALYIIGRIGTAGGTGYAIEYAGSAVRALTMEGRMTLCNMTIEGGARCGMVEVDDVTIDYLMGRPYAPQGELWDHAVSSWRHLFSDQDALFEKEISFKADEIAPQVTWGTSPEMVTSISGYIPVLTDAGDEIKRNSWEKALDYMGLKPRTKITDIKVDKIFIGSCTNGRIEDLRAAAQVARGRTVSDKVKQALVVPGSKIVKKQAEIEGIDRIFRDAGFEWRDPGCSMCLAMNADQLGPGERCASTSNRNFEGRQGAGGRTHLVSPMMAAAAAVAGHFVDVRDIL
jgi:3-isopropylmalate/(R)-2-methylmalate dehydratase large subunit